MRFQEMSIIFRHKSRVNVKYECCDLISYINQNLNMKFRSDFWARAQTKFD